MNGPNDTGPGPGGAGRRVLVVDDDPDMVRLLVAALAAAGHAVVGRGSAQAALQYLAVEDVDIVLTDVLMDGMDGIELCTRLAAERPDVPVIVVTASSKLETAIAAIRGGAYDFITKPINVAALRIAVARALERRALAREVKHLRQVVSETARFGDLIGGSPPMRRVYALLDQIKDSDAPVLISGESGTGKELIARALHRRGRRAGRTFVPVQCAAVPEALLEGELFGRERGPSVDGHAARPGLFAQADGGTLFLDEVGELPLPLQPKLLRAIEERAARPVGGGREVRFDARVIAATRHDLDHAVEERRLREDLYYRINVVHIALPPLRARGRDVLLLAQHFLGQFAAGAGRPALSLSPPAAEKLLSYGWPGNVRELRNCVERATALARGERIEVEDLPERVRHYKSTELIVAGDDAASFLPMDEVERRYVLRVLQAVGNNKRQAARVLGFDRKTLYRKLERYGVTDASAERDR